MANYELCPLGFSCKNVATMSLDDFVDRTIHPEPCPNGQITPTQGAECTTCADGTFATNDGTVCQSCPLFHYCQGGLQYPCESG